MLHFCIDVAMDRFDKFKAFSITGQCTFVVRTKLFYTMHLKERVQVSPFMTERSTLNNPTNLIYWLAKEKMSIDKVKKWFNLNKNEQRRGLFWRKRKTDQFQGRWRAHCGLLIIHYCDRGATMMNAI